MKRRIKKMSEAQKLFEELDSISDVQGEQAPLLLRNLVYKSADIVERMEAEIARLQAMVGEASGQAGEAMNKCDRLKKQLSKNSSIGQQAIVDRDRLSARFEGIRRFLTGEEPTATTNIADQIEYGYGNLSDNGFWQYPVPIALVELKLCIKGG